MDALRAGSIAIGPALLAFLVACLYWPGVSGAATTPRWALLLIVSPMLVRWKRPTPAHAAGGLFVAWAVFSLLWAPTWTARLDGVGALMPLYLGAVIFCLGHSIENMRGIYIGAGIGVAISGGVAIFQWAGLETVDRFGWAGLYVNANLMAEAAALVMVAAVANRLWWLATLVAPALLMPQTRTAFVAVGVALAIHYRASWRKMLPLALICATILIYLTWWKLAGGGLSDRLGIWGGTFDGITLKGHGIGSFWSVFPLYDQRMVLDAMPEYAHHELLHIGFELGVIGVVLFLWFCTELHGPLTPERLVLIALFVEACFGYPFHMPTTLFLGALCAGHAVRDWGMLGVPHARSRGTEPERVEVSFV